MSAKAPRFRVIEGDASVFKPKAKILRQGKNSVSIEKFECAPCSDQMGHPYGSLSAVRIGGHVVEGELVGGAMFWCCRRCEKPYFHIEDCPLTK